MHISSWAAALLLIGVAGCPANRQQAFDPHGATPTNGSTSMVNSFSKASAAFQRKAADALGAKAAKVKVLPFDEAVANEPRNRVGSLWQLQASYSSQSSSLGEITTTYNGWVSPDGTVVSTKENLGLLFEAAGIWSAAPALTPEQLAERLTYGLSCLGWNYFSPTTPSLNLNAGGSGTFTFRVRARQEGPGGAGGGPQYDYLCTVVLTSDHKAKLELSDNLNK